MAEYQVLYWQEIPSQVRAEEGGEEVKLELDPKLQERIDAVATERGLIGSDDYIEQWQWGDSMERPGSAQEVAEGVKKELEAQFLESS
jgi:hypothetical protein